MTDTTHLFILRTDRQRQAAAEFILNLAEKPLYEIVIKPYRKRRSNEANRYYFGVCVRTLAEALGYRVDEMHDVLLMGYFGTETREFRGKTYSFPRRRTTSPNTVSVIEFQGLIQYAQQIAAEMGIVLPDQLLHAEAS